MASAMPDPRLPSQPQETPRPVVLSDRIEICVRQTDRQTDALIVVFRSLSRLSDSFECIGAI